MISRHLRMGVAAEILLVATPVVSLTQLPEASAAGSCATSHGVTLVVDYGALGAGSDSYCISNGADTNALVLLGRAGLDVDQVQRQPGFVCRIQGLPTVDDDACVNTPPANAYWGVFWSSGNGDWVYSTIGPGGLKVDDGGFVGFSWQSGVRRDPGVSPTTPQDPSTPTPTSHPTKHPTNNPTTHPGQHPTKNPTTPAESAVVQDSSPAESAFVQDSAVESAVVQDSDAPTPPDAGEKSFTNADSAGGLPVWSGFAVVGFLAVSGGVVVLVRRRG